MLNGTEYIENEIIAEKNYFDELKYKIYFYKNGTSYQANPETREKKDVIKSLEKLEKQIKYNVEFEEENIKEIETIQDKEKEILADLVEIFNKYGIKKQKDYILKELNFLI